MSAKSIRCALWLRSQRIGKNDVVSVCTYNSLEDFIPMLGTFYEGAVYNTWHHEVTLGRLHYNKIKFK